jgi:glutathione S-transferase
MLRIYGVPFSVHTRKVIVAANCKGLPFENISVVPVIPGNPPPNWSQLSPTGKIPVLQEGERTIADSSVICAYLDRTHWAQPLYPSSDADYIEALWLEEFADGTLFSEVVRPLVLQKFIRPTVHKLPADAQAIEAVLDKPLPKAFAYLDSIVGKGVLAAKEINVAQIAIASNLVTFQYLGFAIDRQRYPHLATFMDRMLRVPPMAQALRAEQPFVASFGFRDDFLRSMPA